LAALGVASLKDLIGRTDLLEMLPGETEKHAHLDLSALLTHIHLLKVKHSIAKFKAMNRLIKVFLLRKWWLKCYLRLKLVQVVNSIYRGNCDRSIGARISGEIARRYGNLSMEAHPVKVNLVGTAVIIGCLERRWFAYQT
jgi:glutamate synthase (NADPH/NADH) large chain